jgi:hypothetical protein
MEKFPTVTSPEEAPKKNEEVSQEEIKEELTKERSTLAKTALFLAEGPLSSVGAYVTILLTMGALRAGGTALLDAYPELLEPEKIENNQAERMRFEIPSGIKKVYFYHNQIRDELTISPIGTIDVPPDPGVLTGVDENGDEHYLKFRYLTKMEGDRWNTRKVLKQE